jgi:heme exporter protein CcmD
VNGYVDAGYLVTFVTLAGYAGWVLYRGRGLTRQSRRGERGSPR